MKRVLTIRVFTPGNDESETLIHRPPAGKKFTAEGKTQVLKSIWRDISAWFPEHDYKLIPLGGNEYNFVCVSKKISPDYPAVEMATA